MTGALVRHRPGGFQEEVAPQLSPALRLLVFNSNIQSFFVIWLQTRPPAFPLLPTFSLLLNNLNAFQPPSAGLCSGGPGPGMCGCQKTLLLPPHLNPQGGTELFDLYRDICSMWLLSWFGEQKTSWTESHSSRISADDTSAQKLPLISLCSHSPRASLHHSPHHSEWPLSISPCPELGEEC